LFELDAGHMMLDRFACMFPLWDAFMRSPERIDGAVAINLLDHGSWPGLSFCDYRPGYYLIPDSVFMAYEQYKHHRANFLANDVAWADRLPIAFWRGSTTGITTGGTPPWRGLPRIQLCEIAAANPGLIDAGITGISQIDDPECRAELEARNLMRPFVDVLSYRNYRYQIDIDGNSNAWEGLIVRLLTGGPVLKVASPGGFQQWYYDRLEPWVNFVPVLSDMSDLVEKVNWLRANDDAARRIGEAGRDLARSLDEREIGRALPVIAAAMHADAGEPLIELPVGAGNPANHAMGSVWPEARRDGANRDGFQSQVTLPRPPGLGDYVLIADVSMAVGQPKHMTIAANGTPLLNGSIAGRTTVYCAVPRDVATASEELRVAIAFPDDAVARLDPADPAATLHRIALAAADPTDWVGYNDINALLAELNSGQASPAAHDLGWQQPERADLILPPGTVGRPVHTWFGTILFADRNTGRIRHGLAAAVPRNIFAIQLGSVVLLARARDSGGYVAARLRPEVRDAPPNDLSPWTGGFARVFTMIANGDTTAAAFGLRAAGRFLCAEFDGECTLSRSQQAEWETFHFQ